MLLDAEMKALILDEFSNILWGLVPLYVVLWLIDHDEIEFWQSYIDADEEN